MQLYNSFLESRTFSKERRTEVCTCSVIKYEMSDYLDCPIFLIFHDSSLFVFYCGGTLSASRTHVFLCDNLANCLLEGKFRKPRISKTFELFLNRSSVVRLMQRRQLE